jgi:hypothetical protein
LAQDRIEHAVLSIALRGGRFFCLAAELPIDG